MKKKQRRRRLNPIRLSPLPVPQKQPPVSLVPESSVLKLGNLNGGDTLAAAIGVLNALTNLPSDRAKARVLRFVEDIFNEAHNH
jgi:hypothetical protein